MSSIDWTKEQRQAPLGLLLFAANTLRKILKAAWPVLLVLIFKESEKSKDDLYFWTAIIGAFFILAHSLLSFWYFRFSIVDNEFIAKKGYLKKIKLSVDIDRIQTVNIKQNILQQILGLVSLEIDTAGAKDAEIKLIAIKKEVAVELEKKLAEKSNIKNTVESSIDTDANNTDTTAAKSIIELSIEDLVKAAISENHLKNLLMIFGLTYGFYSQLSRSFQGSIEKYTEQGINTIQSFSIKTIVFIVVFILIFAMIVSIIKTIVKFYNLKLWEANNSFLLNFGLFNIKKINIPISKIQIIKWDNNPIRKMLGFKTLSIKQASSGAQMKKDQRISIPACNKDQQIAIEESLFGKSKPIFSEKIKTHPIYFIKIFILFSLIILSLAASLIMSEPTLLAYQSFIIIGGLELVLLALLLLEYKKRSFRIDEDILEVNSGQIGDSIQLIQNYKIQSIAYKQSIFMKMRGTATIKVYTAAGTNITIPYIAEDTAAELMNFLLYKIEGSEDKWM